MNLRVANTSWHWIDMHSKIQNMMEKKASCCFLDKRHANNKLLHLNFRDLCIDHATILC
jgi:hypothetical protein